MVATISMSKNDDLDMWDRDFSFCPRLEPDYMLYFQAYVPGHGNFGDNLGNGASCGASTFIPKGRFYTTAGSKTVWDGVGPTGGTVSAFNWWQYSGNGPGDPENNAGMYNYSEWMQLLGGRENYQAWSAGSYELDGGVVLDFEIGASHRKSSLMMAPVPMGNGAQFTYGLTIPADNPFMPAEIAAVAPATGLPYRKRMLDVGPRLFSQEANTFRYVFGASGSLDASNLFKPALARGELQCIGATTLDEYREYVEKDAALERRFQKVIINQPSVEDTIAILRGLKERYEIHHGVTITDLSLIHI